MNTSQFRITLDELKRVRTLRLTPPAKGQSEGVFQYAKICETNATKATGVSLKSPWNKDSEYLRQSSWFFFARTCQRDTKERHRGLSSPFEENLLAGAFAQCLNYSRQLASPSYFESIRVPFCEKGDGHAWVSGKVTLEAVIVIAVQLSRKICWTSVFDLPWSTKTSCSS